MATQATQTTGQVIGFVRQVIGEVKATGSDGVTRILQVGDLVFADEQIATGELGSIEIVFNDGGNLTLGRNSQGLLDADVYQTTTPEDGSEYAASIDAIQQAILLGEDPTAIQEAPAAGPGESPAGNEGSSFVTIERTGAQTTPESGFETEGLAVSFTESDESSTIINLLPTIDLDGDDNSQVGVGYLSHFTENGDPLPIADADIQVSNPDGTILESARIVLTNAQFGDQLDVSAVTGLNVEVDSSVPGVITVLLSGTATPQVYAQAIRDIGFINTTENPDETPRIIEVTVNDGEFDSNTAVTTITVQAVNDPPVVDLDSNDSTDSGYDYLTTFTEGDAAISIADLDASVSDVDNETLQSATVTLTNPQSGDVLAVGNMPAGLSAVVDGHTITISGEASLADYQSAIQAVTFENTSQNPSVETRLIQVTVNDGEFNSDIAVAHIEVIGVNDVAAIDLDADDSSAAGNGYETTFIEDGSAVSIVDEDVVITDVDDANIESASIVLTNHQSFDQLIVRGLPIGITATVDDISVTLTGTASLADYEQALQAIHFVNTSDYPQTVDRIINITLNDGDGNSDTAVSIVHVIPVNDPPNAENDIVATQENTPVGIFVLGNDSDPEGDRLLVTGNTQPSNGTLVQNSNGSYQYTPDAGFTGTDSFTYTVSDGNGGFDTATVMIAVAGVNDGPVAIGDSASTSENTPITIDVLTNDSDPEGDVLSITSVTQGTNGSVTIDPVTGNPVYTPAPAFTGIDTFSYTITDGNGGTDTATVTVTVGGVNDAPVAVDDAVGTNEDTLVTVDVLPNDSDPDGDTLTVTTVTQGANGSVAIDPVSGNPVYTPNADFNGTDTFTYTIDDGNGGTDTATVTVTVGTVNDAPIATDDAVGTNEDTPVTVDVLPNDSDPDGDALSVIAITQGSNGSVTIDPISGNPVYTPNTNFIGTDTFTYTIDDGNGGTDTATVTVTVGAVNDPPIATDDTVGTNEDTPVTVDVLPNDSDPDGDTLTVTAVTQGTNGTVTIDPVSGNPIYTPNPDFNGTDTFTYTIDDGNGGTDTATVTVTVGAVNDAPIATDDAVGTNEDTPVTVDVLPNDSDPDGDVLTVTTVTQGTNGTVTIDPVSGNPIYTPNPDFNGTDTFTYTIDDGNGGTDTATVTVTVGAVNDAPVAVGDSIGTDEDVPVTVDVLPNDSDPDGDTLTVTAVTQGTNGSVTIDPVSGNPVYTPNADFNGTDTFTYTIDDGNGGTDTATVTVTVGAVNDAPIATDDTVGTNEDTSVTVDVLPNDSDPDGDSLTVTAVTQGTNGSVAIDPVSGNPVYTPNADFNGTDTFTYTIDDGNGGTDTATVTVTVGAVNDAPVAVDDSIGTDEDVPVTVDVLPNDSDPDGDTLTVTAVTQGTNGSVSIDPITGNPVYTPDPDFNGTDTFTYTIDDGNGGTDTATVTVTVGAVNDAPVATDDAVGTNEDTPVTVDVLSNDSDPDGDTLTVTAVTQGTNGTVMIDPVSGNLIYTPNPDFNGTDTFTYTIDDGNGGTDTATVTVTVGAVNDAPIATDDAVGTNEDTPVTVDVLPNDSDPDGDVLTVTAVTQGTNGSVSIDPITGNPVYTPDPDFNGTDTFTYTIDDGNGGTDTATVTVTVGAVNDAPVAVDDSIGTDEDVPVTVDVLPNDSDPDGDTLTVTAVTQGTNGTVTIDPVSGNPIYTPNPDFNGTDTFTYTIDDGNGGTDTATVTVTVGAVNDAPVAVDDSIGTDEDVPVTVDVLPNDSDPDGDTLTVTAVTQGTNGSVAIDPVSGNPVYTPNADFNGTDTFTYTIDDGNGGTDTATVTVTVGAVNDAPIATDDTVGTNEDTSVTVDVLPNDSDPDSDTLTVTAVTQGTNGSVSIDPVTGNPVYTPDPDFNGTDTFTYTIDDGNGGTDTAIVTVTVGAVNDAPIATDDTVGTNEDTQVTVDVLPNDSDPDGDTLTITAVTQGTNGSVSIDPVTGNPVYTPDPDFNGTDTFTYTIDDGNGGTDTATVTVTVGAVNDAPVAVDDSIGTDEDVPVTVDVLPNDSDPDGDTLTVTAVTQGTNGSVAIDPVSGNPVYTPNADFNGTDTFTYTIDDGNGGTDTATVTVTVGAVNDAPIATDDAVGTNEDTPVTVDVLPNDSDPDGDTLTVTAVTQGTNGTVAIDPVSGNPVYTPNADFNGTDTFTYTIDDGNGGTDTATVTVTVGAVNDAPVATDDAVGTNEDTPVTVDVLPNDSDPDGDTLTVTAVTQGTNGSVTIDPVSGNPVYTPNADFNGTDTFTYTIDDGNGGTDTATVTVTVGAVNDAPVAVDDSIGTDEDVPVTVDVLPNDSDPDGDTLTVTAVTQGTNGSVAIDPVSGNPVYTPNADFNGTDTFTYTIDDGNGGTDTATVTVTVGAVNDAPVAVDDSIGTDEDVPVTVDVLPNDSDPDGDTLTVTAVTQGTNGSVAIDPVSGNPVYTPDPDFNGTDTFTYTIDDGNGGTDTATVTVTVGAVNDAPVAVDDSIGTDEDVPVTVDVLPNEDVPVTVDVLPNDSDPDGDTLTVTAVTQGTNGSVAIDPVSGNPVYTPDPDFNGTDTFTYTIDDGNGGTDTATVTVTVGAVNDAPVAVDDSIGTDEDVPVTVDVLPNDSDPDGDTLTVTAVTQGTNGSVTIDPVSGNPVYIPNADFNGTDTFTYTIDDGNGGSDTATVTVTVGAVNDAPIATDDTVGTNEDTPVTVDVLPNDSDPDGDTLTVTAVTQGTNGTVAIDPVSGNPVYTPNADFNGTDTFTYTIDDGNGGTDTATVTVTVGAVNDAPVAVDDSIGTDEDVPVTVDVLPNDNDPDGDVLTVTAVTQGTNGTVTIDPVSGNPIYTPNPDFNGTDTFTYTIDDGNGGTDTATVTVTVGAVNDVPVAVDDSIGTDEDVPVTVDVLPNDSDPDGDVLTVTAVTQGTNGSVSIDPVTGNPVYTPDPDFNGTDTFTYTIDDGNGGTDTATVTVTVGAVNDAPVAVDDAIDTDEDVSVTVDVLPNDSDPDGDTLTVTAVTQGSNGSVVIDPVSGNPVYTPDPDFNGTDTFTYTIDDGNGGTDTATVTVTVNEVNDLPEITPATAAVSEEGLVNGMPDNTGTPTDTTDSVTDSGSMSVSDPEGDTLTVSLAEPGVAMTSYGQPITWTGDGTDTLIGSAGGSEVVRISIDQSGNYTVTLSDRVDHPVVGQEDVISFDVDVTVDDGTDSASAPLTIQIEDDAPKAGNISANMYIGVDSLGIQNLAAGWTNPIFINGTGDVTQQDTDADSFVDNLLWGSVPQGGSQSGYILVDNPVYAGGSQSVQIGESFKLADFSHNNWPIYANSSTLDQVTLTIEMDVVVNGIPTTVQFDVLMDHNETPNDGADPRDIITLPAQAVTISIGGQQYEVRVDGFMDANGQIVSTIRTDEQAVNPFEIMGSIVSTDTLPVVTGSVSNITGGDGSASNVVWGDTSSPYGNLTVNSSGAYSFQLNRDTKDDLAPGDTITDTFSYSITDEDGDVSSATLTITIGGYQSIDGSAIADILIGTAADEYLSGYEGNDILRGRGGDDVLDGGSGSDQLRGGGGNDTLIFDSADSLINGNAGFDTLIAPDNDDLDFSSISNIRNIERIDLTVGNHDILNLSVSDVLTMTDDDNLLEILGDTSDSVELTSDWHESGNTVTQNGHTFTEYLNTDDSVTLLIEDQVNVTIV